MLQIDNLTNGYKVKISDWKDSECDECKYYAWQGFYKEIETKIENEGWGYMDNRSGGFLGFILLDSLKCGQYPIFIQLEQETFVFKISTNPKKVGLSEEEIKKIRKQVRNEISSKLIEKAKQKGYNEIIKPSRFGEGVYMAIAVIKQKDWLGENEDIVNVDKVVENLKKYLEFSKEFVEEYNGKE